VTVGSGRFGPYIKWKTMFVSIPKPKRDAEESETLDIKTITLDQAVPLIEKKIETEKNKNINDFDYNGDKIFVLNGMYGPYIKYGKNNFKIPK
jgi:DNA topoisomerase-1